MPLHRFDVIIPYTTNLAEDVSVNTWHYNLVSPIATDYDNVRDLLQDFYDEPPAGETVSITSFMPNNTLVDEWEIRAYNLEDPEPRVPVYQSTLEVTLGSSSPLPQEVALVLSFHAPPESGSPPARRRNRKYLGPFHEGANGNDSRPAPELLDVVAGAARDMLEASAAATSWEWRVHSKTADTHYGVQGGWVDDAWDTQRRRGLAPSSRLLWADGVPAVP